LDTLNVSKMKQYSVIINFTFEPHGCDVEIEYDEDGNYVKLNAEDQAKFDAFERTDRFFEKNDVVEYVKGRADAFSFVECLVGEGEIVSARWLPDKFAIEMIVDTYEYPKALEKYLRSTSLEDSEYEACGDTGWIVMTRGPKGECFGDDGKWDMKNVWEYGLTDYRNNEIIIKEIGEKPDFVDESKLFLVTEKGLEFHKKMGELKWKGIKFSEEDEANFKILCKLLKDPKVYPV
jgi:hypothetical protein